MIRINLLDWRAERRERRQKQFTVAVAMVGAASAAIVFAGLTFFNAALEHQNNRNEFLKAQIREVDAQIKEIEELEKVKADLIARMEVIEELQRNRTEVVHFFDELVDSLPDGVYLTNLKQTGKNTSLSGTAESNGRVSKYMKNLDASEWFEDPNLVVIKVQEAGYLRLSDFEMKVKNSHPNKSPGDEAVDEGVAE